MSSIWHQKYETKEQGESQCIDRATRTYFHQRNSSTRTCSSTQHNKDRSVVRSQHFQRYHKISKGLFYFHDHDHISIESTTISGDIGQEVCHLVFERNSKPSVWPKMLNQNTSQNLVQGTILSNQPLGSLEVIPPKGQLCYQTCTHLLKVKPFLISEKCQILGARCTTPTSSMPYELIRVSHSMHSQFPLVMPFQQKIVKENIIGLYSINTK